MVDGLPLGTIPAGTDVIGADGAKLGELVAAQPGYLVVAKGFFFTTDYYIPTSAIASYDGTTVTLGVTTDEALGLGWDVAPSGDAEETATSAP